MQGVGTRWSVCFLVFLGWCELTDLELIVLDLGRLEALMFYRCGGHTRKPFEMPIAQKLDQPLLPCRFLSFQHG